MTDSNSKTASGPEHFPALAEAGNRRSLMGDLLSTNKWIQLLEIIIVFVPPLLVIVTARWLRLDNPMLLIYAVCVSNVVMLGLIWLSIRLRQESWKTIGLTFERVSLASVGWTILKSLLILIFAIGAFVFGSIVMANIVGIPEDADLTKYNYLRGNLPMLLISLAGVYFVSSFGEEVVYRGFLITRLQELFGGNRRLPIIGAVIVSSVIFGFAHFEWGAMGIAQTTCMGAAWPYRFYGPSETSGPWS